MILTVQELIYRIQFQEDEAAFNLFYKQYVIKLRQFAYTFLGDSNAAEEIVNDVFLKIWLGRHRLSAIKNIQVYLYIAVKNNCLNYLRGLNAKTAHETHLAESFYFHIPVNPVQLLISKELGVEIVKAINELPPKCRLIFKMVKEDGLSSKEVAVILNLSDKTVFAQLSIALKKIGDIVLK